MLWTCLRCIHSPSLRPWIILLLLPWYDITQGLMLLFLVWLKLWSDKIHVTRIRVPFCRGCTKCSPCSGILQFVNIYTFGSLVSHSLKGGGSAFSCWRPAPPSRVTEPSVFRDKVSRRRWDFGVDIHHHFLSQVLPVLMALGMSLLYSHTDKSFFW